MRYLHIFTILGALAGALELLNVLASSSISARQQAAGAAMAVAWTVILYCFVRALVAMEGAEVTELRRLNALLGKSATTEPPTPDPAIPPVVPAYRCPQCKTALQVGQAACSACGGPIHWGPPSVR